MATGPSEEDLFSSQMQDVQPLGKGREQNLRQKKASSTIAEKHRREAALGLRQLRMDENTLTLSDVPPRHPQEYLEWKKTGVQRAVFNKLRKGGYPLQGELDLHRKTVKEARELVFKFLKLASERSWRSLLIAHGKGEFSKTPGRLKSYLAAWLTQHDEVMAFCSAQRPRGGVGAVYVLVRKSQKSSEHNREAHGLKSDPNEPTVKGDQSHR